MGKPKKNIKKQSKPEKIPARVLRAREPEKTTVNRIDSVKKSISNTEKIVPIPARILRSKTIENTQPKVPAFVLIPSRVLRSGEKKKAKENISPPVLKKTDTAALVLNPSRVLRSSEKKEAKENIPKENIPPPVLKKTNTAVCKRAEFVKVNTFKVNDIVLAKQKYSIPWPARVIDIRKEKVSVYFFGDRRVGPVNSCDLFDYIKSFAALKSLLVEKRKARGFITGLREVELLLGIAETHSVFDTV